LVPWLVLPIVAGEPEHVDAVRNLVDEFGIDRAVRLSAPRPQETAVRSKGVSESLMPLWLEPEETCRAILVSGAARPAPTDTLGEPVHG
jgi:hypothetical protein